MKGILSELTRRFPHTRVSSTYPSITYNRGNKTLSTRLYSARLTRQKENKRPKGYERLSSLWVIASIGSITKRASLYSISLAVIISSLTNHLCKHLCYFKQVVSNQNHFTIFHILGITMVLDRRQVIPYYMVIHEPM